MAATEAQKRASKKWREKNKTKQARYNLKSSAKAFVITHATDKELVELERLIGERRKELSDKNSREN